MDTAVAQWAERRGRSLTVAETSKYVQTHLDQSVDMQIVIAGECRELRRLSGGSWQMDLASPHGRAVDCIPVYFSNDVAAAVGGFLKHRVGRRFGDHITNGAGVTIAGNLTVSSYTRALQLRANQVFPERTDLGPVTCAENAHRDRLATLGFPKSLFTQGNPTSLKWPDKLRHITVISSNGSKAVTDIKAMLDKVRVGVPTLEPVVVSMNRHQIAEHLVKKLATIEPSRTDLVVITRGGGHWTDLWSFHDADLAHAIRHCRVPVMVALGHAADEPTNADYAATGSFTTPSAFGTQLAGHLYKTTAAQKKITPTPTRLHAAKKQPTGAPEDYRARYDQLVQWHTATTHNTRYWRDAYVDELRTGSAARVKLHCVLAAIATLLVGGIVTAAALLSPNPTVPITTGATTLLLAALCWHNKTPTTTPPRSMRFRRPPHNTHDWIRATRKARTPHRYRTLWTHIPPELTQP